jgi:hypothetical protein
METGFEPQLELLTMNELSFEKELWTQRMVDYISLNCGEHCGHFARVRAVLCRDGDTDNTPGIC